MYEKARTYMKFRGSTQNCILLIINNLSKMGGSREGKKGNQKMKDEPTMLLKTKENKSDILDDPTIFMKIKDLCF